MHAALASLAATRSTSTVAVAHNCLTRLIRYAEARDLVRRNVSALVDTPKGQPGRRPRSLTLDQAVALLTAAANGRVPAPAHPGVRPGPLMHAYITVSLTVGLRTAQQALAEARRVLAPGGRLLAMAVCRFASLLDGLYDGRLDDPDFRPIVAQDLLDGQHRNPDPVGKPEFSPPPTSTPPMA